MRYLKLQTPTLHRLQSRRSRPTNSIVTILCLVLAIGVLASCGSTTTAPTKQKPQTHTPVPSASPTPTPTPEPTSTDTPSQPSAPPPSQPQGGPAILDLLPASMSFVGNGNCPMNMGVFVCQAQVISDSANQSQLNWTAFANFPGVGFSPSSGTLAPGQRAQVTVTVPARPCPPMRGSTFFFKGNVNTHTISWAC